MNESLKLSEFLELANQERAEDEKISRALAIYYIKKGTLKAEYRIKNKLSSRGSWYVNTSELENI